MLRPEADDRVAVSELDQIGRELAVEVEVEPRRVRRVLVDPADRGSAHPIGLRRGRRRRSSWPYPSPKASGSMYTSRNGGFSSAAAHCPSRSARNCAVALRRNPSSDEPVAVRRERGDRSSEPLLARRRTRRARACWASRCRSRGCSTACSTPSAVVLGSGSVGPVLRDVVSSKSRVTTNAATSNATTTTATTTRRVRRRGGGAVAAIRSTVPAAAGRSTSGVTGSTRRTTRP